MQSFEGASFDAGKGVAAVVTVRLRCVLPLLLSGTEKYSVAMLLIFFILDVFKRGAFLVM